MYEGEGRHTQRLGKESWGRLFVNSEENFESLPFQAETIRGKGNTAATTTHF